jgi:hypothetical protein
VAWRVVGYQHRGLEPSDPDEHFGWDEYLLYNAKRGSAFWWIRPRAGAWSNSATGSGGG